MGIQPCNCCLYDNYLPPFEITYGTGVLEDGGAPLFVQGPDHLIVSPHSCSVFHQPDLGVTQGLDIGVHVEVELVVGGHLLVLL